MNGADRRILIFAIHRTVPWWHFIGRNMGWGDSVVVTDLRGEGDISIVDDFYTELDALRRQPASDSAPLSDAEVADVIGRCRTLRWLDRKLAVAMTLAMAKVLNRVLDRVQPSIVISFPIDRYVKDVLERLARRRGVPYLELTASVVPGMSMLLRRGAMVESVQEPDLELTRQTLAELAHPGFAPAYVPRKSRHTRAKFLRTQGYLRARGLALRAISIIQRDPLNLHYLDAQPFLGHKCRWKDVRIVGLCDVSWRDKVSAFARDKRVLFGLQLFPEASIDYWIPNAELIDHENIIVQAARAFSTAGYLILVKDHPLQFGFRHTALLDRLRELPNVVIVPSDVSGNELLGLVGVNFTCTGTLGLQAALAGLTSVVTESYYSNDEDFIVFRSSAEINALPARVAQAAPPSLPLELRQQRMISHLLRGSFDGDFFSFKRFDARKPAPAALRLAQALGRRLDGLVAEGAL